MWYLAIRQLLARKKQSLIVVFGILVGTAAYVSFSGIMLGFQEFMIDKMINSDGHLHITAREKDVSAAQLNGPLFGSEVHVHWLKPPSGRRDYARIDHPTGWFDILSKDPKVLSFTPTLQIQALAQRGLQNYSVRVLGVDPYKQIQVTNINDYIQNKGSLIDIGRSGGRAIFGKLLLAKLGGSLGESITLTAAQGKPIVFKAMNTFETGAISVDENVIYTSIADAQKLNGTPSQISDISVRLVDPSEAETLADSYSVLASDKVQSWQQLNQNILSVFDMQTMIRNLISFCIVLVAGFGIYNILNVIVTQKRHEIGILRSMGFDGGEITELFVFQGLIFGCFGGVLGLLVGYFVCNYISTLHIGVPGTVGYRNMLVSYNLYTYMKAFLMALGTSLLAGYLPARAAGKLEPIDIIRSEGG